MSSKPNVGVSACLLGQPVRFNGGHKKHRYITDILSKYLELRALCPETACGMKTPRKPIHLENKRNATRCVQSDDNTIDVTDELASVVNTHIATLRTLDGFIVASRSPSCGLNNVTVREGQTRHHHGTGIFTQSLIARFPNLPIEDEGRLNDPQLRENFVQRVFAHQRWRHWIKTFPTLQQLHLFHQQHRLLLTSHSPVETRELSDWVLHVSSFASQLKETNNDYLNQYFDWFMNILSQHTCRAHQTDCLRSALSLIAKHINDNATQHITNIIASYQSGVVPLIVPITLLQHYFSTHLTIDKNVSRYLSPYPREMQLMNRI